jgi:putative membrane protein
MGWSFDAPVVLGVLMAAVLYGTGVRRLGRTGTRQQVPPVRIVAFGGALLLIVLALESPLDGWADRLLWVHMVQHELLIAGVAPLLLLGAPLLPLLHGMPLSVRRSILPMLSRPVLLRSTASLVARLLWTPWLIWTVFVVDLVAWHIPPVYDLALRRPPVHDLEHVLFLGTAVLFWAQIIPVRPLRRSLTLGQQALFLGAAAVAEEALDLVFVLAPDPLYRYYMALPRWPGAPSVLSDQSIAAGVMEILGMSILGLAFMLLLRQPRGTELADLASAIHRNRVVPRGRPRARNVAP